MMKSPPTRTKLLILAGAFLMLGCNPFASQSDNAPNALCLSVRELGMADGELALAVAAARVSDLTGIKVHSDAARQHKELAQAGIKTTGSGPDDPATVAIVSTVVAVGQAASFIAADTSNTSETVPTLSKLVGIAHQELVRTEGIISSEGIVCS